MSEYEEVTIEYDQQNDHAEEGVVVPMERINPDTLRKMVEEFVTREWSELADAGCIFEDKIAQVLQNSNNGYKQSINGIEQKTLVYGDKTLMVEFRLQKGATLPLHSHPHEQTGYLVKGQIRLTIGADVHVVMPGDSWCISGNTQHSAAIIEDSVAVEVFSPVREDYRV